MDRQNLTEDADILDSNYQYGGLGMVKNAGEQGHINKAFQSFVRL